MATMTRKRWSDLPLAVRRLAWWWLLPVICMVAGAVWYAIIYNNYVVMPGVSPYWAGAAVPLVLFAPLFVSIAVVSVNMHRMKRAYTISQGCICTNCTHNITGLGETGSCPECNYTFDLERDRKAWKQAGVTQLTTYIDS